MQQPTACSAIQALTLPGLPLLQVLHRDIKPGNIMVTNQDVVKIGDLGIAKILKGRRTHRPPAAC